MAVALGILEFRLNMTTSMGPDDILWYDSGRAAMHFLTFGLLEP